MRDIIARMASIELDGPESGACPLLGLASDRRSHFTYPHPSHRCFARKKPATTDARRQVTYCLSPDFKACDRFRAWQSVEAPGQPLNDRPAEHARALPAGAPTTQTRVIKVFRAGDSLSGIAATYGLTVEQLAKANGLTANDTPPEGARLVIPPR